MWPSLLVRPPSDAKSVACESAGQLVALDGGGTSSNRSGTGGTIVGTIDDRNGVLGLGEETLAVCPSLKEGIWAGRMKIYLNGYSSPGLHRANGMLEFIFQVIKKTLDDVMVEIQAVCDVDGMEERARKIVDATKSRERGVRCFVHVCNEWVGVATGANGLGVRCHGGV